MTLRKWMYLFFTTLLVGGAASVIAAAGLYIFDRQLDFWGTLLFNIGAGFMFSVLSQMGFFAYLALNYIAKGFIRRRELWQVLQWILIIIAVVDAVYLRWLAADEGRAFAEFLVLPACLLAGSLLTALWKSKLTNKHSFTPTVFFMFVATLLETVPALREDQASAIWFMIVPLFFCNAWQILNLHKLVDPSKEN